MKKNSAKRKLIPAAAMLCISAAMLATSTYAWFTMNKEVSVKGMQVKATAEQGLLINEVKGDSSTWDSEATGGDANAIALRPASTKNLNDWWHANSKVRDDDAGANVSGNDVSIDTDKTVAIDTGKYYTPISGETNISTNKIEAQAGTNAEKNYYYKDLPGGTADSYDFGEAYYVKYTYFIKSSGEELQVSANKLTASVTAEKKNTETENTSVNLDKSLRVGVKIGNDYKIFAPITGASNPYYVTTNEAGSAYEKVEPSGATATGINASALTIPAFTAEGMQVDVFVWFEGEDENCKSSNITAVLDSYEIKINFVDADLV